MGGKDGDSTPPQKESPDCSGLLGVRDEWTGISEWSDQ